MLLRGHISLGSSPSPDALNCQVYASVGMSADDGALVSDLSAHDYSLGQHALPLMRPASADIWTRGVKALLSLIYGSPVRAQGQVIET